MITLDSIDYALHSIQIKDANGDALAIDASGNIGVTDAGGSLTVDAVDLDIRDLSSATDSVAAVQSGSWTVAVSGDVNVTQGTNPWVIGDGGGSITVDASQLDIDDLDYTSDNVAIKGATGNQLVIESNGSINANIVEGGYDTWEVTAETVDTTAGGVQLVSTALTGRVRIEIQNLGSQDIWIRQATGVTTSNGLKIPKGSSYEQALDENAEIWAITASGSSDVRVAEYAA